MTSDTQFGKLRDDQFDAAHAILVTATEWLLFRNIRQWTVPFPRQTYREWQDEGANYGLMRYGELAAVVSIRRSTPPYWIDRLGREDLWWLSKLAVAPAFRGQGLGRIAVETSKRTLSDDAVPEVYTDVVYGNNFLPEYYQSLGFEALCRQNTAMRTGLFDMVLLKSQLMAKEDGEQPHAAAAGDARR